MSLEQSRALFQDFDPMPPAKNRMDPFIAKPARVLGLCSDPALPIQHLQQ